MDYYPPHVDMTTANIAQDNLTPNLTRICPVCFEKWTGRGAQVIYHIQREHPDHLIKQEESYQDDGDDDDDDDDRALMESASEYNEYTFTLLDNSEGDEVALESGRITDEIVRVFIELEKVFVLSVNKFPDESGRCGFYVSVNYIGPYMDKVETIKFTCTLQYELNDSKNLSSVSDVVGETAEFIIDEEVRQFKKKLSQWPAVLKIQVSVRKMFQQLIDAMKRRLTCSKCKVMLLPPIRQCRYGHIICQKCADKMPSRPVCPSCHNDSLEFHKRHGLSQEMHPGMRQSQMKPDLLRTVQGHTLATGDNVIGPNDRVEQEKKLPVVGEEFLGDFGSKIGNLRLLEEQALQVAYGCDEAGCDVRICCLDLEEHRKECH